MINTFNGCYIKFYSLIIKTTSNFFSYRDILLIYVRKDSYFSTRASYTKGVIASTVSVTGWKSFSFDETL